MSALGQKRTSHLVGVMSALPPKADINRRQLDIRFMPKADVSRCSKNPQGQLTRSPRRRALEAMAVVDRQGRPLVDSAPPRTSIHLPLEILAKRRLPRLVVKAILRRRKLPLEARCEARFAYLGGHTALGGTMKHWTFGITPSP
jgi:hypothetical protein